MLDYDYIKNYYRLLTVDLRRQKDLGADPKVIQLAKFAEQLKHPDEAIVANESIFV